MIRKLVLPVLAAGLLAGCVSGYNYRAGHGDYYYGNPSVEYRYNGGYYGGYYGGFYGGYGYPGYGYPYRYYGAPYRHGYYGYPGYGYPYNRPYRPYRPYTPPPPRPGVNPPQHRPGGEYRPDNGKAPWRDLDGLRRSQQPRMQQPRAINGPEPARVAPPRPVSQPSSDGPRATPRRLNADRVPQQER